MEKSGRRGDFGRDATKSTRKLYKAEAAEKDERRTASSIKGSVDGEGWVCLLPGDGEECERSKGDGEVGEEKYERSIRGRGEVTFEIFWAFLP